MMWWMSWAWAAPGLAPPSDGQDDAALVIGIDDYLLLPDVPGADDNASDWVDYLTARGVPRERVVLLRDAEANDARIRARAEEVAQGVGNEGRVWLVFVGHGAPSEAGEPLLVGVDAAQDTETLLARSVPKAELLGLLGASGRPVVAIVDACFSGRDRAGSALVPDVQPVVPRYSVPADDGALTEVTAAAADQFAGAWPDAERPALSWLLLHPEAAGEVSLAEAVTDAERRLRTLPTRRQTPRLHGPGDLLLGSTVGPVAVPTRPGEAPAPAAAPNGGRKNTGWKIVGTTLGIGALGAGAWSAERRQAATTTGSPNRVEGLVSASRGLGATAWTLTALSAASFTVAVVR